MGQNPTRQEGEIGVGQIAERLADGLSWLQTCVIATSDAWSSPWSGSTGRFDWPGGVIRA
jgi:hypothetical protein